MSQNFETYYSTLSNMRAYRQKCYNFFSLFYLLSLSSQHISLSICNTALSLSPLWSPSLCCSLFLSHFHFFYLSLSSSLSAFRYHHQRSDPIHAQNFSYTSPSRCTAVRFSASLARFALLIGSIHPRP